MHRMALRFLLILAFGLSLGSSLTAGAACGLIPGNFPLSSGSKLDVDNDVTVNGNPVAEGKTDADSVVGIDGSRDTVAQVLPDLDPPTFPVNTAANGDDATEADSPFVASTDLYFDEVKIGKDESATFSGGGPFHINKLEIDDRGTLNLEAGTYFIDEFKIHKEVTVNVLSEPVLLHIGDKIEFDKDVTMNGGGNVIGLQVFLHDGAEFKGDNGLDFTGLILGPKAKKVELKNDTLFHGAIVTSGEVKIKKGTQITYTAADQAAVNAISTCRPDHFSIAHDGTGVTCDEEPITIAVHLNDHSVLPVYTGAITLSTSTGNGDWSVITGSGVLDNGATNNGIARYFFALADAGQVVLGLRDTVVETTSIDIVDGGYVEDPTEDPSLSFAQTGFVFLADGVKSALGIQIAGKASNISPGAQLLELQAVRTSDDTGACEAALVGPNTVDLAFECEDPIACSARPVSINGVPIAGNDFGSLASFTGVDLDFGDTTDSTATFVLDYLDAGRIQLHARFDLPLGDGSPSGNLMVGSSNEFVVRPFGFDLDFSDDRANNGTTGPSFAADDAGSRFVKAGENFDTTVTAVLWEASDDANADGRPDAGANLGDNAPTPNFGQETSPATVEVARSLFAPAAGSPGTLSGGSALGGFSAGARTATLSWDEVGIIDLDAIHVSYLGTGVDVTGVVGNVGRFYPARFTVSDNGPDFRDGPDASWTCPFTYLEQRFTFLTDPIITLAAENLAGGTVLNYGGNATAEDFWKFDAAPFLANRDYADTSGATAVLDQITLTGTVTLSGDADYADGLGDLTISGDQFAYLRDPLPETPFSARATLTVPAGDLIDTDGVCFTSVATSCNLNDGDTGDDYVTADIAGPPGSELRFGRLVIENAFGSETADQTVPLRAEYYDGVAFVTHLDDDCTAVLLGPDVNLFNPPSGPQDGDQPMTIGAGTTSVVSGDPALAGGVSGLVFGAPGAGNTGYVDIEIDLSTAGLDWLRYDWDGDGAHDDHPIGRVSFGIYQGPSQIIYRREPWN